MGAGALSAEDYAKAKENFKKRSSNFGDNDERPQDFAMNSFISDPAAGRRRESAGDRHVPATTVSLGAPRVHL